MTTTELRELIPDSRHILRTEWAIAPAVFEKVVDALEQTLARLEAAEKVCEAAENMRDVSLDLKTALGLEHKVHEALDAWSEAKTYRKVIDQHDERSSSHLEDKWFQMERDKLKSRLHEAENLIHAIAEWTDDEKLEAQCLQFLDGEI